MLACRRFDNVYHVLFRCARHTLASHEHLHGWLRDMTSILGMKTIRIQDWRHGYYQQLFPLNPSQIVPRGPSAEELGLGKQDEERLRALDVNSSDDVFFRKRHEQIPVS
jgi:glutathionyl-hydroquinone reductase